MTHCDFDQESEMDFLEEILGEEETILEDDSFSGKVEDPPSTSTHKSKPQSSTSIMNTTLPTSASSSSPNSSKKSSSKSTSNENLGFCLNESFQSNYNLNQAYHQCIQYLESIRKQKLDELSGKIDQYHESLELMLQEGECTSIYLNKVNELKTLRKDYQYYYDGNNIEEYQKKVKPLVDRFNEISDTEDSEGSESNERLIIIDKFLTCSGKYVPVNVQKVSENRNVCHACGYQLNSSKSESSEVVICNNCGCISSNYTGVNLGREGKQSRQYHSKENYYVSLQHLQGKIEINSRNALERLMNELDEYFIRIGVGDRFEVRNRPLTTTKDEMLIQQGKEPTYIYQNWHKSNCYKVRKGTDILMLREALGEIRRGSWYRWVYYIAREYWYWYLIELSSHEEKKVLEKYDEFMKHYNRQKTLRTSSPNTNYLNYFILNSLGYIMTKRDINIVGSRQTINDYLQNLAPVFRELGYDYVPI